MKQVLQPSHRTFVFGLSMEYFCIVICVCNVVGIGEDHTETWVDLLAVKKLIPEKAPGAKKKTNYSFHVSKPMDKAAGVPFQRLQVPFFSISYSSLVFQFQCNVMY